MARTSILTRSAIIARGLQLGGNPGLTTEAETFLNLWLDEMYAAYDWPFLLKEESITISGTTFDLSSLSNTFRSLKGIRIADAGHELVEWREGFKDLRIQLLKDAESSASGEPQWFSVDPDLSQERVYVYPTPDQSYSATIWYYYQPAALSTDVAPTLPSAALTVNAIAEFAATFDGSNLLGILDSNVARSVRRLRANMRQSDQTTRGLNFDRAFHNWKSPKR